MAASIDKLATTDGWARTNEIAAYEHENGKGGFVLRQKWVHKETGQIEWLSIPYFDKNGRQIKQ